ncbi:hypothetical protein G9A89_008539 [Geosiphon pyriformis]|nr:hypothetical protein G9A89_008539 [Geosiphon pyriformis]
MSEKFCNKVESAAQLDAVIKEIVDVFQEKETEHTWQLFEAELKRLAFIIHNGAFTFEQSFFAGIKILRQPILNSIATERTRLSGAACELVEELGRCLGSKFESLAEIFIPSVLKLCARSNKVFITRAQKCVTTIIRECKMPGLIPKFKESLQDQSKGMRTCAAEFILISLEVNDVGALADYRMDLEWAIRHSAVDSIAAVRTISKKIFEVYKLKFDLRFHDFIDTLDATAKKYLGIKEKQPIKVSRPPIRKLNSTPVGRGFAPLDERIGISTKKIPEKNSSRVIAETEKSPLRASSQWNIDIRLPPTKEKLLEAAQPQKPPTLEIYSGKSTAFVVPFDETKSGNSHSTSTGFVALKQPKFSSAQRVNTVSTLSTTAKRIVNKPSRTQTIPSSGSKQTGPLGSLIGGAQRIKLKESVVDFEDKSKDPPPGHQSRTGHEENGNKVIVSNSNLGTPKLMKSRSMSVPASQNTKTRPTALGVPLGQKTVNTPSSNSNDTKSTLENTTTENFLNSTCASPSPGETDPSMVDIKPLTEVKTGRNKIKFRLEPVYKGNIRSTEIKRSTLSIKSNCHRHFSPYKRSTQVEMKQFKPPPENSSLSKRQSYSEKLAAEQKTKKDPKKRRNKSAIIVTSPLKQQPHFAHEIELFPSKSPPLGFVNPVKFLEDINSTISLQEPRNCDSNILDNAGDRNIFVREPEEYTNDTKSLHINLASAIQAGSIWKEKFVPADHLSASRLILENKGDDEDLGNPYYILGEASDGEGQGSNLVTEGTVNFSSQTSLLELIGESEDTNLDQEKKLSELLIRQIEGLGVEDTIILGESLKDEFPIGTNKKMVEKAIAL